MFKNLHLKILSLTLAILFWIFVVSLENTFSQFPEGISIKPFNLAEDLALSSKLGEVKLTLRAQDQLTLHRLAESDFEAYVDLKDVGAGTQEVSVLVNSKNPQINIVRVEPSAVSVTLEPVRQKIVPITADISGKPAEGFSLLSVKLSRDNVTVSGAESMLKKISYAKALVGLQGTENRDAVKPVEIEIYDEAGVVMEELKIESEDIEARLDIIEAEQTKEVGIKARFIGVLTNAVIKKVTVEPALVSIVGPKENVSSVEIVETEEIDLEGISAGFEKKAKLVLPKGVALAQGQSENILVKVQVEQAYSSTSGGVSNVLP